MDTLWAPWRKGYVIKTDKDKGCVFCRDFREGTERDDRKNLVLLRGEKSGLILNLYPYNNGHLMAVPKRHISDLAQLQPDEAAEIFRLTQVALEGLKKVLKPHGFNIGINLGKAAGAGIAGHLHLHIVPRWQGDCNFMPVVSGTKSIPDSLDILYRELGREVRKLWQKKNK